VRPVPADKVRAVEHMPRCTVAHTIHTHTHGHTGQVMYCQKLLCKLVVKKTTVDR